MIFDIKQHVIQQKSTFMKKAILALMASVCMAMAAGAQTVYSCDYKSDADVKVYVADYKSDADLVVYKCSYKSDATGNNGLWYFVNYRSDAKKKIFFVKRYNCRGGSFVIGGVGFVARKEVNYFNFPMKESVQGWRLKWFYIRDSSAVDSQLPQFSDVLEAEPKKSWKNILSPDEKPTVNRLFEKFLRIKEFDGQTMIGTEVAAVFLKR
jgi:hypothetical protein